MNFYEKYLQNLICNVKMAFIVHLILVCIPSILILFIKNKGGRRVGVDGL